MEVVGHLTYILIVSSYLVRDMLALRSLAILASLCSLAFSYSRQVWLIFNWNLVFLVVNFVQLGILLYERRPIAFDAEEEELRREVFQVVPAADLRRLLDVARWEEGGTGEVLLGEGEVLDRLVLLARGWAEVAVDGRVVGRVPAGGFVGEMGFLTGAPASAEVRLGAASRYLSWPTEELERLLAGRGGLRHSFQGVLGEDLIRKIRAASRQAPGQAASPPGSDGEIPVEALTREG